MDRSDWDKLAPQFETNVFDITAIDSRGVLSRLVARARPRTSRGTLVDLGCGIGTFVKEHRSRFADVVALDFSPAMIERAKEQLTDVTGIEWVCSDIPRAAELLAERGDLTVCLNVITSPSASKRAAIWDAVARITRRGGWALVVIPALESARMLAEFDDRVVDAARTAGLVEIEGGTQKYYTREELESVVGHHGLAVEAIERVHYPWAEEALRTPRAVREPPFDWAVLARRPARES